MPTILVYHRCGCAYLHRNLPDMPRAQLEAVKLRMESMDCPDHWSGGVDLQDYFDAAIRPDDDDPKGGGA